MNRTQEVELTNMCFIYDENRILVEEKKGTKYTNGLVFPGGHIEQGESFRDSVIREIKEETGLDIFEPQPCGFKDWIQDDGTRYIVFQFGMLQHIVHYGCMVHLIQFLHHFKRRCYLSL